MTGVMLGNWEFVYGAYGVTAVALSGYVLFTVITWLKAEAQAHD